MTGGVSRRVLIGGSAAFGVGLAAFGSEAAHADGGRRGGGASVRASADFLAGVTDAHREIGPRLAQSYQDSSGLGEHAFTYDNALAVIALLADGDLAHASALGEGLLYAQDHDPEYSDGRLRQTYQAGAFINDTTKKVKLSPIGLSGTAVGDMSWAGIALTHLARRTRRSTFRTAALRIADWISDNTRSTSGLGGYTFGPTGDLAGHKSTEHNIDVYAFFRLLAELTGDRTWLSGARHAWAFVERMWNSEAGFFWTGSDDGTTINKLGTQWPLDAQTWSWLAARRTRYAAALDWAAANLATTDTPLRANSKLTGNYSVTGVAFGSGSLQADPNVTIDPWNPNPDTGAVWFEGTSQLALALLDRGARGDRAAADALLDAVRSAQGRLGQDQTFNGKAVDGGVVAASSPMHTGFGFGYYQNLHVGATSWYVFAGRGVNPYRFW